jgi:Tfp pilus assembly protein PilF
LPSPNAARLTLAKLHNVRHEFNEAIDLARQQLAGPGADARGAHLVIATAQLAVGDLAHAAEEADAAIALRPDSNGYVTRALVRQAQGRDLDAAGDFARAAASEQAGDKHGAAHLRALWGRFLLRRGAYTEAGAVIDEALRIVPESPIALGQRGELLLRTGKAKDAAKTFEHAFERSRQVRYLLDEARARDLAGEAENARQLRAQIETIVRGDPRAHSIDLIEVLVDGGTPAGVAEAVQLATAELGKRASFEVRFQLARALARGGRLDEAMVQLDAAVASGAREAQLFELLAYVERKRGDTKRAGDHTRIANELDPTNTGWRTLGISR